MDLEDDEDEDVLVEEDEEDLQPESNPASLAALLGAKVVDARQVESSVIDSCDAKVELTTKRYELAKVSREIALLELRKSRSVEGGSSSSAGADATSGDTQVDSKLEAAAQRRAAMEAEVADLEERASRSVDAPVSLSQSQRWLRLRRVPESMGSQDLDDRDEDESREPPMSQEDIAVAAANAAVAAVGASQRPLLPLREGQANARAAANVSAKDYLAKFRRKVSPPAPSDEGLPEDCRGGSSSSTAVPSSTSKSKRPIQDAAQELVQVKEEPQEPQSPKRRRPALRRVEEPVAMPDEGTGILPEKDYMNVHQLVPKVGHGVNVWKENNPAEWRAILEQGEVVSPHKNLLKRPPGSATAKRPEAAKKVRRDDDTNEKAYQRRQAMWLRSAAAQALRPKQSVDQEGKPISKKEETDEIKEEAVVDQIQDDVHVAEGLRSPRWLWEALYPYQHTCVKWLWGLHCEKTGGILADEMGLGKTIQIAAYLAVLHHSGVLQRMRVQNTTLGAASAPKPGGVLIVCPATLISQWRNELNLWYPPLRICVMHQVNEKERRECIESACSQQGVLITSYETMRLANEALLDGTWVVVVLDEGQKIRNPHASLTIAAKRFSTPHRIILSGSPIQNNLQELWSLFDFVCPGRLGTLPVFLEEFAQPIESGNLVGAGEVKVAAAYQCAMALRQLTEPCILRRTKAECMDVLKLPSKQEQVLFCNLTPEQFQVYVQFLETEQVRRAKRASTDRKAIGAVFFAISVLRKLCNHPDLLLRDLPDGHEDLPDDMYHVEKSGKMKVLAEIMKLWHRDKHRVLIFVQTVQMLEVIQAWMSRIGYTHLRIDGKTAVKRRLKLIEEFNENTNFFAMILTTRVGGVGLNIVGADRVLIFDPDWNPMTDVQARERAWRIGQKKEVSVYRLVLSGTIEEKIYQRQVYKHFLAQKVLQDPRQRQFFKWNDLADLFDVPPPPPNVTKADLLKLKDKYKAAFRKLTKFDERYLEEGEVETTEVMKAISDLPSKEENVSSKATVAEGNAILRSLYDKQGIKASFNHDKVEQTLLDRKIVRQGANLVAQRALEALKKSARERSAHHISEPTWTGQKGRAGGDRQVLKQEAKAIVKREPGLAEMASASRGAGVSSADILQGLRQLAAIRAATEERAASQSAKITPAESPAEMPDFPSEENCVGLPIELLPSDRKIAEDILRVFLDRKIGGEQHRLTTGQVLETLAVNVAAHHNDLFKSLLKQLCTLSKSTRPSEPSCWTLREEYWPRAKG